MQKIKIGFVPSHRVPFSLHWAKDMRERCIRSLSELKEIELVVPDSNVTPDGLVRNEEDAKNTIELFQKSEIRGLLIGTMTFGEELPTISIAEAFSQFPIMLFGTKEGPFTPDGNRLSDSFCGTLSVSSGLCRRKIKFGFAGIVFPEENDFKQKVRDFAAACLAANGFVGARIGQVGPRPAPFETCAINEVMLIEKFRQRVIPLTLADAFYQANMIDEKDRETKSIVAEIRERTDCSKVSQESILKAAKLEKVLSDFIAKEDISCLGVQCWTAMQEIFGISSCLTMGRLTEKGYPAACEVDLHGALTMLVQYLCSFKTTPPHFIDWTIQNQENENVFFAWHCGNAPSCLAAPDFRPQVDKHSILLSNTSYGTLEFQLRSGVVTLGRLVEYDGQFKMLITTGKIVEDKRKLRGSWSWVEVDDLEKLYETLVYEGFTHHASLIHGNLIQPLIEFCRFTGIKAVIV